MVDDPVGGGSERQLAGRADLLGADDGARRGRPQRRGDPVEGGKSGAPRAPAPHVVGRGALGRRRRRRRWSARRDRRSPGRWPGRPGKARRRSAPGPSPRATSAPALMIHHPRPRPWPVCTLPRQRLPTIPVTLARWWKRCLPLRCPGNGRPGAGGRLARGPAAIGLTAFDRTGVDRPRTRARLRSAPWIGAFSWASVTKPATALAVLVAVEEGTAPARRTGRPPRGHRRHLLAHVRARARAGARRGRARGPPHLLERRLRGAGRPGGRAGRASPSPTICGRRPRPAGHGQPARPRRPEAGAAAGLPVHSATCSLWARAGLSHPGQCRDPSGRGVGPVPGPGWRAPRLGWFEPCDWGLGVEIRGQATALDRHRPTPRRPSGTSAGPAPSCGSTRRPASCARACATALRPWAARAWPRWPMPCCERRRPRPGADPGATPRGSPRLGCAA